ncbi:four helix bundle protein [Aquimarina sp. U1-2]|nr:four helix bundle protein [Aquimarina sp. U1-2]
MNTFRNVKIWQKAMMLVTKMYTETKDFPKEEIYDLTL